MPFDLCQLELQFWGLIPPFSGPDDVVFLWGGKNTITFVFFESAPEICGMVNDD